MVGEQADRETLRQEDSLSQGSQELNAILGSIIAGISLGEFEKVDS